MGAGLIVIPDVFGIESGRHRAICDALAEDIPGLLVLMPDIFEGDPFVNDHECRGIGLMTMAKFAWSMSWSRGPSASSAWFKELTWEKKQKRVYMDTAIPYLEAQGAARIAVLGFCFGTYGVFRSSSTGRVSCGISFHPAVQMLGWLFSEDDIEICKNVKCPQMVVHCKGDAATWLPEGIAQCATDKATDGGNVWRATSQNHGFMSRGNAKDDATQEAIREYYEVMVDFLFTNLLREPRFETCDDVLAASIGGSSGCTGGMPPPMESAPSAGYPSMSHPAPCGIREELWKDSDVHATTSFKSIRSDG